jgi:hypothetical protein
MASRGFVLLVGDCWIRFLRKYCAGLKIIVTSGFLRPDFDIPYPVVCKPFGYDELESRIAALRGAGGGGAPA